MDGQERRKLKSQLERVEVLHSGILGSRAGWRNEACGLSVAYTRKKWRIDVKRAR